MFCDNQGLFLETDALTTAYQAFMLAHEAARHSPETLNWYERRLGPAIAFFSRARHSIPRAHYLERLQSVPCGPRA